MLKTNHHRHGRRSLLVTFFVLAAALLLTADRAQAQVTRTVVKDFTDSLVNQCTGETIAFSGSMTTTSNVQDNGHRTNFRFTTDVKGRGVVVLDAFGQPVTNGAEYKIQTRVKSVNDQLDPVVYPFSQSQEIDMKLVGAGGENNFFFRFNARLVINAQGDLTVFKETSDLRCESVPAFTKPILLYTPTILYPDIYTYY
jgi:hypothetical protein